MRVCADGTLGSATGFDGTIQATTTLSIGSRADGLHQVSGTIKDVHLWNTPLTDTQLTQVTK